MHTLRCYEIPDMIRDAFDRAIDPETGELTDAGAAELRSLTTIAQHSIADLACYIRELESESTAIKAVIESSLDRAGRLARRADRWRSYLLETLDAIGETEVKDPRIRASIKLNPPAVEITNSNALPDHYFRVIPEKREPDKVALKAALRTGVVVPGASLKATRRLVIL